MRRNAFIGCVCTTVAVCILLYSCRTPSVEPYSSNGPYQRICIVRPFAPGDVHRLVKSIQGWHRPDQAACMHPIQSDKQHSTLLLYFSRKQSSPEFIAAHTALAAVVAEVEARGCFNAIRLIGADLTASEDKCEFCCPGHNVK